MIELIIIYIKTADPTHIPTIFNILAICASDRASANRPALTLSFALQENITAGMPKQPPKQQIRLKTEHPTDENVSLVPSFSIII